MYLSIDIDFWNRIGVVDMDEALCAVRDSGKLRQTCDNHKRLLKSINASGQTTVVNVDTHSDIVTPKDVEFWRDTNWKLTCGNWANYVRKDLRGRFVWVYPTHHGRRCDHRGSRTQSPFQRPDLIGWGSVEKTPVEKFPMHLIDEATDIGISISYYYLRHFMSKAIVQERFHYIFGRALPQYDHEGY